MDQINAYGGRITIIHLVYLRSPTDALPENKEEQAWRIACMPNMVELGETQYHPNYQRTDDPRAVTCPACKKTDFYKRGMGAHQK